MTRLTQIFLLLFLGGATSKGMAQEQKYIAATNSNPVTKFIEANAHAFGEGVQEIKFPLFMRLGTVGV